MSKLAKVVELTREARDSAHAGDWSRVAELEEVRRPLIHEVFAQSPAAVDARSIREILGCDRELIELARSQRAAAGRSTLDNQRNRRAIRQYAQAARSAARG